MSLDLYAYDVTWTDPEDVFVPTLILWANPFETTPGELISVVPVDGSQLNIDPTEARWTPVMMTVRMQLGLSPIVVVKIGYNWFCVYDGAAFAPLFSEHSSVVRVVGSDTDFVLTVLPNGGWWRSAFELVPYNGSVLAAA